MAAHKAALKDMEANAVAWVVRPAAAAGHEQPLGRCSAESGHAG